MKEPTASHEHEDHVPAAYRVVAGGAAALRPIERCVLRWTASGVDDAEIARRFGRSARWVAQVRMLAHLDRAATGPTGPAAGRAQATDDRLRPLERRILRWREEGVDHDELSTRFRRSPGFLARVERYAHYKLARAAAG